MIDFQLAGSITLAEDINTSAGFVRHLWAIMNMLPGALCTIGVVCSTWSICNRSLVTYKFVHDCVQ